MRRISIRGFTMIELLIVIAIIGILATVGLGAAFGQSRKAAKDAKMKSHISALQIALESYYSDNKKYPNKNQLIQLANDLAPDYLNQRTMDEIVNDLPVVSVYAPKYRCTNPAASPPPPCLSYEMSITLQIDNTVFTVESN